jgi:cytochrome c5
MMGARSGPLLLVALLGACSEPSAPQVNLAPQEQISAAGPADMVARVDAAAVFDLWCEPCHAAGAGHPGTNRLAERLGPERATLLERTDLNEQYVKTVVRYGFQMMPPFRHTEISDAELQALAAWVVAGGRPGG